MRFDLIRSGEFRCVGIDPGGTTGIAIMQQEIIDGEWIGTAHFDFLQLGPEPHHKKLFNFLEGFITANTHIVCESFQNRGMDKQLISAEYVGVVRHFEQYWQEILKRQFVWTQTASTVTSKKEGASFWQDAKIKKLGLWVLNQKHAMDALRHLLHHITFTVEDNRWLMRLK